MTDTLTPNVYPTITGNTVQIAPASQTGIPVSLGVEASGPGLVIDPTTLVLNGLTLNGPTLLVGLPAYPGVPITASSAATASIIEVMGPVDRGGPVNGGTLGLFSAGDIVQKPGAVLWVGTLVGRAGTNTTYGDITLNEANAIGTIGLEPSSVLPTPFDGLTAAGNIALKNFNDLHIVGRTGLVSGVGTAVPNALLTLEEYGELQIDGPLGNCGTGLLWLTSHDSYGITIGSSSTAPTVWSFGPAKLTSPVITLNNGVVNAVGIDVTGNFYQNRGTIASFASMDVGGSFYQSAGSAYVEGALSMYSGNTLHIAGTLAVGSANLPSVPVYNSGLIIGNDLTGLGPIVQNTGKIVTTGNLNTPSITGNSGTITVNGSFTLGSGTGTAGTASGTATSGIFSQSGGTIIATGDVTVWSTSPVTQSDGTLAAGGTLAITAPSIAQGTGGTGAALLSGGYAVRLYATSGDARQGDNEIVAGAGALAGGSGIAIQAPNGDNTFWHFAPVSISSGGSPGVPAYSFQCSSLCVSNLRPAPITFGSTLPPITTTGTPDVLLLGNTVDLFGNATIAAAGPGPVLTANALWLFSLGDTTEKANGVIAAPTVNGNAGYLASPILPGELQAPATWTQTANSNASLGMLTSGGSISNPNQITTLGTYAATGTLSMTNSTDLTIDGATAGTSATITAPTVTVSGR